MPCTELHHYPVTQSGPNLPLDRFLFYLILLKISIIIFLGTMGKNRAKRDEMNN